MQRTTRKISAVCLTATLLAACQPAPPVATGLSAAPAPGGRPAGAMLPAGPSRQVYKPGKDDSAPGTAQVLSQQGKDRITIRLARRPASQAFKTQAINVADLAFVRVWVTGPGISGMIESDQGELAYPPTTMTLSNVPSGQNRVITAQYYDSAHQPIPSAVAKGIYSTSGTGPIPVEIRRRFVPLGRIIEDLLLSNPTLAKNLETGPLQDQLDDVLFSGTLGVPDDSFDTDPALLDLDELVTDLRSENGRGEDLTLSDYVLATASLQLEIAGLLGTDKVTVRVGDTTSAPAELVGNGPVTISNIAPGIWPVYVFSTTGAGLQGYAYENSTLSITGSVKKPPLLFANGTKAWHQPPEFVIGETIDLGTYTLAPKAVRLGPLPPANSPLRRIRENSTIRIQGNFFHHNPLYNEFRFENLDSENPLDDRTVTTGPKFGLNPITELNLSVPPLKAGRYRVSMSVAGGPAVWLGIYFANTWYVKPDGDPLADGTSWETATTLQNALSQSAEGQSILLATGTYRPSNDDIYASFEINDDMTIEGGYVDNGHGEFNKLAGPSETVLSCDLGNNDGPEDIPTQTDRGDNCRHVLVQHSDLKLDNLTVSGGHAFDDNGGAIHNFVDNTNGNDGALTELEDVVIENNSATFSGGGLYLGSFSRALFEDVILRNNAAYTARGGGMAVFSDGALDRRVSMDKVRFENNLAASGGGLYLEGGVNAVMNNLYFLDNQSFFPSTEAFAEPRGGALFASVSSGSINNAVFAGNEASTGGAINLVNGSNFQLNHVSFANNRHHPNATAEVCGTAWNLSNSTLSLRNSIAWSEALTVIEPNRGAFTGCYDGGLSISNSLIDGLATMGPVGSGNVEADPGFVDPGDPHGDGLQLATNSPARNLGAGGLVPRDILAQARDTSPDAGAYESD